MTDQRKKPAMLDETQTLDSIPTLEVEGDETRQLRSLSVQEIEQILRDEPKKQR